MIRTGDSCAWVENVPASVHGLLQLHVPGAREICGEGI